LAARKTSPPDAIRYTRAWIMFCVRSNRSGGCDQRGEASRSVPVMEGRRDKASVTSSGERLQPLIDGVRVRYAKTQIDERGELCEIYDPSWALTPEPLVYVYTAVIRPGRIKGWVYHREQVDRMFVLSGFLKIVLYDVREKSNTRGMINEIHLTERNRGLLIIPALVIHAVQNVGSIDGAFINMPSCPYNHANPDKYRVDKANVPYDFDRGSGW
jgi:dTDP-4-dehydrorhamnose 3,5-epimerase